MKRFRYAIFSLIIFFSFFMNTYAKNNPYPHYEDLGFGKIVNCTWYAWDAAKKRQGIELPTWYNVWTWHKQAKKAGFATGKEPRKDSLMIWNYGDGFGGHVSYVTAVNGDVITYDEGGAMNSTGIATDQTISISEVKVITEDYGFIYLDVPRSTTTKNTTTSSKKTTTSFKKTTTSTKEVMTSEQSSAVSSSTTSTSTTEESTTTSIESTTIKEKIIEDTNKGKDSKMYIIIISIIIIVMFSLILLFRFKNKK